MSSNFRPKESRGLQDVRNPSELESAILSDVSSQAFPSSRGDVREVATDHPDMSIVQQETDPSHESRNGVTQNPPTMNSESSIETTESRLARHTLSRFPSRFGTSQPQNIFNRSATAAKSRIHPQVRHTSARNSSLNDPLSTYEIPRRRDVRGDPIDREPPIREPRRLAMGLTPEERRDMNEIYEDLKQRGFDVPLVPEILSLDYIFAALEIYFVQITHEPAEFEHTPAGAAQLISLLDKGLSGYAPVASPQTLTLALEKSYLNSCWNVILHTLSSLRKSANENTSSNFLPNLDKRNMSDLEFPEFLESAEASEFVVSRANEGDVPPEISEALNNSLKHLVGHENYDVNKLEGDVTNMQQTCDDINDMLNQNDGQQSQILALQNEINTLNRETDDFNSKIMAKNRYIADLASDLDIESQKLMQAEELVEKLFTRIVENNEGNSGLLSMEYVLEMATSYNFLRENCKNLAELVRETGQQMTSEYERPAREKLTSLRIAVDEYNSRLTELFYEAEEELPGGISVPKDLELHAEVPRAVTEKQEIGISVSPQLSNKSIWGRSAAELLNTEQDLGELNRNWLKLQDHEARLRTKLEDDTKEFQTEIPSLETRKTSNVIQIEKLLNTERDLQATKSSKNETLIERRVNRESRSRAQEAFSGRLESLSRSLEQTRKLLQKLEAENVQNSTKMRQEAVTKKRIEVALLDHRTARKTLNDKIEELIESTEKMKPSADQAQKLLANLTPTLNLPPKNGLTPQERALELLKKSKS